MMFQTAAYFLVASCCFSTQVEATLSQSFLQKLKTLGGPPGIQSNLTELVLNEVASFTRDPPPREKAILRPPMGWNSWNWIQCNDALMNEKTIKSVADAIVDSGLRDAGYEYLNLDDCWMQKKKKGEREIGEPLKGDEKRFPSGMKALGDYIHSKGLKFGIYGDCGTKTCQGFYGSLGNEELDAKTFTDWGVDYLKLDGCWANIQNMKKIYTDWSWALYNQAQESGRNIVFSCSWPAYAIRGKGAKSFDWDYISKICDLWRVYGDISKQYESVEGIATWFANNQDALIPVSGPGSYNDADMLELGNGINAVEEATQMNIWAILGSPLLMGHDVRSQTESTLKNLKAQNVIAVNQDKDGKQGRFVAEGELGLHVWMRDLSGGSKAIVWWNRANESVQGPLKISWKFLGLENGATYSAFDTWTSKDLGTFKDEFKWGDVNIPAHGSLMIVLLPSSRVPLTFEQSFLAKEPKRLSNMRSVSRV